MLTIALSLSGLERAPGAPWEAGPRAAIQWAADAGFRAVTLDGTAPGLRARELDRSARRDLAALLRRLQLRFAGLDLWIPPAHFTDPARAERAIDASLSAIDLCAELARLGEARSAAVSLPLPLAADAPRVSIEAHAGARGVDIAVYDYAEPDLFREGSPLGAGIDPAAVLLAGADPVKRIGELASALKVARLSDTDGISRRGIGLPGGRLDLLSYGATLSICGYSRETILDLRGVRDQQAGAHRALELWRTMPFADQAG